MTWSWKPINLPPWQMTRGWHGRRSARQSTMHAFFLRRQTFDVFEDQSLDALDNLDMAVFRWDDCKILYPKKLDCEYCNGPLYAVRHGKGSRRRHQPCRYQILRHAYHMILSLGEIQEAEESCDITRFSESAAICFKNIHMHMDTSGFSDLRPSSSLSLWLQRHHKASEFLAHDFARIRLHPPQAMQFMQFISIHQFTFCQDLHPKVSRATSLLSVNSPLLSTTKDQDQEMSYPKAHSEQI